MGVSIKSEREIALMREGGKFLERTLKALEGEVRPGISTWELNKKADEIIRSFGCVPSFLNYNGFPASICTSVNEVVVHGIPDKKKILREGDIISIDAGVLWKGYHADAARTFAVGAVPEESRRLMQTAGEAFFAGLAFCRAGCHLNEVCSAIDQYIRSRGYGIVTALVGHGIGRNLHEAPEVPNFSMASRGIRLAAGMTLAIEPMINIGRGDVEWLSDEWTVVTEDGSRSAHYENTVLITREEPELLTLTKA